MNPSYSYSFNRHWHIVWSWKQFMFGYTIEFSNIYILAFGFLSLTWIRT